MIASDMKLRIVLTALLLFSIELLTPKVASAVIQSLNGETSRQQTFQDDSNVTISSLNDVHSISWQGLLPLSRGGTGAGSFTDGSIPFIFNGIFTEDNSNLFWDNINKFLGIGTSSPTSALDVSGNVKATSLTTTSDSIINSLTIGKGGGSVPSNTTMGQNALLNNSTGQYNVAVGTDALSANTVNSHNTAVGYSALKNMYSTEHNTAVGSGALQSTTTGGQNTAFGSSALLSNATGANNTAIGYRALVYNNSNSNVALGFRALASNTSGSENVAIGYQSMFQNVTGGGNVAIGTNAAWQIADGSYLTAATNNIYIGGKVRANSNNEYNSIVIGNEPTTGAGSNTAVIGNANMTDIYFGSAAGVANIHGKKMYLGSSSIPGCMIMGDSDGNGVTYLTVNDGVLSVSTTPPSACQ